MPERVIFDTDPGIGAGLDADDPLALMLILASPELELVGVTTVFGNVEIARATESALRVLEATGHSHIPVNMGMSRSIDGVLHAQSEVEYQKHRDNIGPVDHARVEAGRSDEHAVDFIVREVSENPGEITLIAVGPLSNLAMALLKRPQLAEEVRRIVIMGGAFGFEAEFGRGNVTPVAEYNVWHDPMAAKIVFESGIPLMAIGLDVTNPNVGTVLYEDRLNELIDVKTPFSEFLHLICRNYIDAPRFDWATERRGCILYDPVAVAAAIDRSLVEIKRLPVLVETAGHYSAGQTMPVLRSDDDEAHLIDICVDVDGERFIDMFVERIAALRDSCDVAS